MSRRPGTWLGGLALLLTTAAPASSQPLGTPTLVRPAWNLTGGGDAQTLEDAMVELMPVATATHYDICLRQVGQDCYFLRRFALSEAQPGPNGALRFWFGGLPANREGTEGEWLAAACRASGGTTTCGQWSSGNRFIMLTNYATATAPASGNQPGRTVTFSWVNNPLADAGSQLILLHDLPHRVFSRSNPTVVPAPSQSIALAAGVTSHTVTIPSGITSMRWAVGTCRNYPGKGRRCSQLYPVWRTVTVPSFGFTSTVAATFKHQRCMNCHAVAADNFQNASATSPNRGLPASHPTVTAATSCSSCHTNALLPSEGTVNPGWHAAPASMDFRNKTDAQLCLMAQLAGNGTVASIRTHLTEDKLILWAVGDGRRPAASNGSALPPLPFAPPGSIAAWRTAVNNWIDSGMPCQ